MSDNVHDVYRSIKEGLDDALEKRGLTNTNLNDIAAMLTTPITTGQMVLFRIQLLDMLFKLQESYMQIASGQPASSDNGGSELRSFLAETLALLKTGIENLPVGTTGSGRDG